jgi:hypothetical protein
VPAAGEVIQLKAAAGSTFSIDELKKAVQEHKPAILFLVQVSCVWWRDCLVGRWLLHQMVALIASGAVTGSARLVVELAAWVLKEKAGSCALFACLYVPVPVSAPTSTLHCSGALCLNAGSV